MSLKELIIFQKVAHYKSFSKASEKLFFSQPTITRHISELEKKIGSKLFFRNREKSTLELTYEGETFLYYIHQIVSLYDEAIEKIENIKKGESGTTKIALTASTGCWLFPLLDDFKKHHINFSFEINVNYFSDTILDLIKARKIHFGFIKTFTTSFADPLLVANIVLNDEIVLVFSPNHRFSRQKELTLANICTEPIIAFAKTTKFWEQVLLMFHKNNLIPKVTMEAYDFQTVKLFVQKSFGVAFLPKICVQEEIEKGIFKTLPIKDCPPIKMYLILIYRKDMVLNDIYISFLDMIFKHSNNK